MLGAIKNDFSRSMANRGFAFAVVITAALCFTEQIFCDNVNGRVYSVFEAFFTFDRAFMERNFDFNPAIIIGKALSGYSAMALPVTAAFPFVFAFVSERNSGNMRFVISRTGRLKYYFSKYISSIFSGGFCTMLGVLLFALFAFILFPSGQNPDTITEFLPYGALLFIVKKSLSALVYGAASVLPAFFLCSFCTNPYIILCVPFLLKFMLETLISEIQKNAISFGDIFIYEKIIPFDPTSLNHIFEMLADKTFFITIAVNVVFAAAIFAGYAVIMEKRADRGS